MQRRSLLRSLVAGSVVCAASLMSFSQADESDKVGKKKLVNYLFVQNATQTTLKDGVLTLKGVSPHTLYFSDRPDRIAGRITVADFVKEWSQGKDSFKKNPPNAVLTVLEKPEAKDIVVVLRNPRLKDGSLMYDVQVTDGDKDVTGESCSLFIDVIGMPRTPLSFAGAARRTVARAIIR